LHDPVGRVNEARREYAAIEGRSVPAGQKVLAEQRRLLVMPNQTMLGMVVFRTVMCVDIDMGRRRRCIQVNTCVSGIIPGHFNSFRGRNHFADETQVVPGAVWRDALNER
jgi:hypothetical protein